VVLLTEWITIAPAQPISSTLTCYVPAHDLVHLGSRACWNVGREQQVHGTSAKKPKGSRRKQEAPLGKLYTDILALSAGLGYYLVFRVASKLLCHS
jgi:hypothetical protein